MTFIPYSDQIRMSQWQKMRRAIFLRDNDTCTICGLTDCIIHCHHWKYEKGRKAWSYSMDELTTLCDYHHSVIHGKNGEDVISPEDVSIEQHNGSVKIINDNIRKIQRRLKENENKLEPEEVKDLLLSIDSMVMERRNLISDHKYQHVADLIVKYIKDPAFRKQVDTIPLTYLHSNNDNNTGRKLDQA